MALEELLLYFLGVPAAVYAIAIVWCRGTMRTAAQQEVGLLRKPEALSKFFIFASLLAYPIPFGAIFLVLALPLSENAASLQAIRAVAVMFTAASVLATLSEAWIVVRRTPIAYGELFGRVLVLAVMPLTVVVFALLIGLLVLGRLPGPFDPSSATNAMIAGALAAPLMAALGNREEALGTAGFGRAVVTAAIGEVPLIVALVIALMAVGPS